MYAKLTRNEFLSVLNQSVGKKYDMDNYAGFQCFDYANYGWNKLFGYNLAGNGAKDIPSPKWNNFTGKATVYKNTPSFLPEPGDLVVWGSQMGNGWGHVAWVVSATLNQIVVIEQNWLGGGWTTGDAYHAWGWEGATRRVHSYNNPMWFIRPNFKPEKPQPKTTWKWSGVFTANSTIKVRVKPGLRGRVVDKGSWIYKNQWVKFVSITKKDGYWWGKFKYPTNPSSGYFYMALGEITDKKGRIKKEKKLYGRIKWL